MTDYDEMTMAQLLEQLHAADTHARSLEHFDDAATLIARDPRDLVRGVVHRDRHSIRTDSWSGEIAGG